MTDHLKLLLIQPPVQDFYDTDIRLQPIGLAFIKGAIRKHLPEVDVVIRDYHHGWGRKTIPVPKELAYLKEYYAHHDKSPFSVFHHYYHFGADFDEIVRDASALKPDLIGISSLFSPYYREALRVARDLKSALKVPILMGGPHVSAMPDRVLSEAAIDFVITGEGEKPIVELLKLLKQSINLQAPQYRDPVSHPRGAILGCLKGIDFAGVPNLGWKRNGELIFNERQDNFEIEDLPEPDLSDLDIQNYLYEKKPLSFVVTSRSCPHRCSFCSVHKTFGFRYRRQSVNKVLEGIRNRYEQGVRVFDFEDDNLTFYKDEMKELCRRLIEMFPRTDFLGKSLAKEEAETSMARSAKQAMSEEHRRCSATQSGEVNDSSTLRNSREFSSLTDVQFVAMNGISYLSLDSELMKLMRQAGFTHLNLALVSSDITVRESTKRPHTIPKYLEVVKEAQSLGFHIVSYQILGLPNETLDSMIQTLVFNAQQPVLMGASMFYMTPNSPIAKPFGEMSEENIFKSRLTAMAWETDSFKREDIFTLFITTRIINFLKGLDFKGIASLPAVARNDMSLRGGKDDEAISSKGMVLEDALAIARQNGGRDALGAEILKKLLAGEGLYAATTLGLKPVKKFNNELFFRVWNQLGYVTTQAGKRIDVGLEISMGLRQSRS